MRSSALTIILFLSFLLPAAGIKPDKRIEQKAIKYLKEETIKREKPVTVTDSVCSRSAGGKHDFYSEADYSWPDPANPGGPYINRDGMTYPGIFTAHRYAMIRLSQIIGSLASAYKITGDEKYVEAAFNHLKAWFVDTATMMNPSLLYGQAII